MNSSYIIEGMTCDGCIKKVNDILMKSGKVNTSDVKINPEVSVIDFKSQLSIDEIQSILIKAGDYTIKEFEENNGGAAISSKKRSWFNTYKPILLIFGMVALVSWIAAADSGNVIMNFMRYFMAGFFMAFSFFKFLDLSGFANAYQSYDLLAARWKSYGYIYPFIELGLGIAYLTSFYPFATYLATIIIMGFSSIGVINSVVRKSKIQCACLGTVFNLPMSTVTIVEDLLMVLMAVFMLITF